MPGIQAWYGGAATLSGALVGSWTDLSGNGSHATATGAARPTWVTNSQNGQPIVRFAGAQHLVSAYGSTIEQPNTYLIVVKCSGAAGEAVLDGIDGTNRNLVYHNATATLAAFGGTGQLTVTPTAVTAMSTYLLIFNGTTLSRIRVNGGAQDVTGNASAAGVAGLTIGAVNGFASNFFTGDMATLIHWAHAPTAAEITAVEAWAREEYGTW